MTTEQKAWVKIAKKYEKDFETYRKTVEKQFKSDVQAADDSGSNPPTPPPPPPKNN
jgi:hypothetical protein